MQHPAHPPMEVVNALEGFLTDPGRTNGDNDRELKAALTKASVIDDINRRHLGLWADTDEKVMGATLERMPRTFEILFPRDLAREYGKAGLSIPISSILRWAAIDNQTSYYLQVADALDELDCVTPDIAPLWRDQNDRLQTVANLASFVANGVVALTHHGQSHVGGKIVDAVRDVLDDTYRHYIELMMPTDILPGWMETKKIGFRMPVGSALMHLAADIGEADPTLARKLTCAVEKYYPDDDINVEVALPDEIFHLVGFHTQRSRTIPWQAVRRVRPLPGSVTLDHYGDGSAYSANENEHPFKLVRYWLGDEDDDEESWEEGCLLFSEDLIVHAAVACDLEN